MVSRKGGEGGDDEEDRSRTTKLKEQEARIIIFPRDSPVCVVLYRGGEGLGNERD